MRKKLTCPQNITPLLAEEIGLHLGDGSMNYYNGRGFYQLRGHISDDKKHYQLRIKNMYKELFNIDVSLREMPSSNVYGFQIWSDKLVDYKHRVLGLPLGKKSKFQIPTEIITSAKLSRSFLRGYFDTDGCLYIENKRGKPYPRIEMASISKEFTNQLNRIMLKMGFRTTHYKENRRKYGWKDIYRIITRGNEMTRKWFLEIEPRNPKHIMKFSELKLDNGPAEI